MPSPCEMYLMYYIVYLYNCCTQEGAADDDGLQEMGPVLSGHEQRGPPEAHPGTEPRSWPSTGKRDILLDSCFDGIM